MRTFTLKRVMWWKAHSSNKYLRVDFFKRLYIKSCTLGHTDRAYLNSRQQCPLTSGWTMLNSLCLIRWLTLQRRQGHSLICNWADGGQTHRITSTHWILQLASECVCVCGIAQCCPSLQDRADLDVRLASSSSSTFSILHQWQRLALNKLIIPTDNKVNMWTL